MEQRLSTAAEQAHIEWVAAVAVVHSCEARVFHGHGLHGMNLRGGHLLGYVGSHYEFSMERPKQISSPIYHRCNLCHVTHRQLLDNDDYPNILQIVD